jgi:hypothetical protein
VTNRRRKSRHRRAVAATGPTKSKPSAKLGTFSTLSIGIGGMVGGGIFAVTVLTIEVTQGTAPVAKNHHDPFLG